MKTSLAEPGCGVQSSLSTYVKIQFRQIWHQVIFQRNILNLRIAKPMTHSVCIMWIESQLYTIALRAAALKVNSVQEACTKCFAVLILQNT